MATGTVTRFVEDKGFGFIKTEGSDKDVFFHFSAFEGEPREGMQVTFDTEQNERGPRAVNVKQVQ